MFVSPLSSLVLFCANYVSFKQLIQGEIRYLGMNGLVTSNTLIALFPYLIMDLISV